MRVAAIDIGTNTTRLLVADVRDGRVDEVVRRTRITRLGEGVDRRRRLLPQPIARVRNTLVDYRREAEALGAERALAIATSAVRDAENGEAFLGEVEWSYGFTSRLLTGDEEAELTFRGVATRRGLDGTLVFDVGGGSTELILGDVGGIAFHDSLDVGAVRLTERFIHTDPPTPEEVERCRRAVRAVLEERVPEGVRPRAIVGVAGTVTTLVALEMGLPEYDRERVDGGTLTLEGSERQLERLAALPLAERREVPALEPDRAPVAVAGAVIVCEVLRHFHAAALEASERDLLDGAALAAAALPAPEEGAPPPGAYTCC